MRNRVLKVDFHLSDWLLKLVNKDVGIAVIWIQRRVQGFRIPKIGRLPGWRRANHDADTLVAVFYVLEHGLQ